MKFKIHRPACALLFLLLGGFAAGVVNGVFGTGGGIIAVFVFSNIPFFAGVFAKKDVFAMTLFVCFIMSLSSAVLYLGAGNASAGTSLPFLLPAAAGGALGALLLDKIKTSLLSKIFAALVIYAGAALFLR
ncbi:MAG: TSUP family transporter [Clostridia bacterium]|nr:TSUP family transporter [Clostridia bacterium]